MRVVPPLRVWLRICPYDHRVVGMQAWIRALVCSCYLELVLRHRVHRVKSHCNILELDAQVVLRPMRQRALLQHLSNLIRRADHTLGEVDLRKCR